MMTRTERRLKTCRHFNGIQNTHCRAGHAYERFRLPNGTFGKYASHLPCLPQRKPEDIPLPTQTCDDYTPHTPEEVEAEDAMWDEVIRRTTVVRPVIVEALGGKPGWCNIDCPICSAPLYAMMASNGHVHARCETADCVNWME